MLSLTNRTAVAAHRTSAFGTGFGLMRLLRLARSRRALADLSPEQLADVGIAPEEAAREARRPFWDAPAHWRG